MTSNLVPMAVAARQLGVTRQALKYFSERGKLTVIDTGRILLIDPTVAQGELEQVGYYRRAENRKRKREAAAQAVD